MSKEVAVISIESVEKAAKLARLKLSANEISQFSTQLEEVVRAFAQLQVIDTQGVEPLITPTELAQRLREDKIEVWNGTEEVLANAPERKGNLFKVPPVV